MQKFKALTGLIITLLPILLVSSCTYVQGKPADPIPTLVTPGEITYWFADRVVLFDSIAELEQRAVYIVSGKFTGIESVESISTAAQNNTYFTRYFFEVDTVIKGDPVDLLIIRQAGWEIKQEVWDDPLFRINEESILFLTLNDAWFGGRFKIYSVRGGPQGRYTVIDGKVYSMNYITDRSVDTISDGLRVNGIDKEGFIQSLMEMKTAD